MFKAIIRSISTTKIRRIPALLAIISSVLMLSFFSVSAGTTTFTGTIDTSDVNTNVCAPSYPGDYGESQAFTVSVTGTYTATNFNTDQFYVLVNTDPNTANLFNHWSNNLIWADQGYSDSATLNAGTTYYAHLYDYCGYSVHPVNYSFDLTGPGNVNNGNDADNDGVPDGSDVCPGFDDNVDTDSDGTPDGCDSTPNGDDDNDGVDNAADICPGFDDNVDTDTDGTPDGCDSTPTGDDDNDGVDNASDICPGFNDNVDTDTDGTPDGCDSTPTGDDDNDGVDNASDICPGFDDNVDTDTDGTPDGCDSTPTGDDDNDGVDNASDICPGFNDNVDTDTDGTPDGCDSTPTGDDDNDGVDNASDICPGFDDNVDTDTDGTPDGCDSTPNGDDDNDGVDNASDICPGFDDNVDSDTDGIPDGCDTTPTGDKDADGIDDATDNCPNVANATQSDSDSDGIGDACDTLDNNDLDGDGVSNSRDACLERGDEGYGVQENGCPPHVVLPPDNRINWQYGDLNAIIYNHADGVAVYCYNQGSTWLGMHINQAMVDNAPVYQPQTVPVAEYTENGCHIAFYILDNGEYQLNIWTWDGKLYELIADNINFSNATMRWFE